MASLDFPFASAEYIYRPLRLKDPMQKGWDVYALQTGLKHLGYTLITDGWFGTQTDGRVRKFQVAQGLKLDGIAGTATQNRICARACQMVSGILPERVYGQMEQESGFELGNYTAPYVNGSRDRGVLQENSEYYPDNTKAFDVAEAISAFVPHIIEQHDRYVKAGVNDDRAWAAAQGYWNNHVYANEYAIGKSVPDSFLAYISSVTAYVQ